MAETITQYRLETFLRGRLGTDANVGTHSAADDVAVIDGTIQPVRLPISDVGRTLKFKFVTSGQQIDHVPAVEHTFEGNSLRTLAPASLRGTRDQPDGPASGSDLLIQWYRRSRLAPGMRPSSDVPVGEEQEMYDVEIYSGATLKRTIRGIKPGIKLASFFIPERPNDYAGSSTLVMHNRLAAIGGNLTARTAQNIPVPGNLFLGTLQTFAGAGFSALGLGRFGGISNGLSATLTGLMPFGATLTGVTTPYLVILEYLSGAPDEYRLSVYENGSRIFSASSDSGAGDYDPNFGWHDVGGGATGLAQLNIQFVLLGSQVLVQKGDRTGSGYTTFAKSTASTEGLFPLHGLAAASAGALLEANVDKSFITTFPDPGTIYSVAEQTQDFGSAQTAVKVRVYQLSGVIGRGHYAEATI